MSFNKALLIVDMQNDFCPGGQLPVKDCTRIIPAINAYIEKFKSKGYPIFASRDWHPKNSRHFAEFEGSWPAHCVKDTEGASFHSDLKLPESTIIISKGTSPGEDGYSAFEGHDEGGKSFEEILKGLNIGELYVCGVATDYCVKSSALDARQRDLTVFLLTDAIEGVDVNAKDTEKAMSQMSAEGIIMTTIDKLAL